MATVRVEDVFKISGVPTHTFVRPSEFSRLQVSLRTPGRGVIVECPSGIGKSTAITKALQTLGIEDEVTLLSARVPEDVEYLELLPDLGQFGTVVIDDFHRLEESLKARIADLLKVTADAEDPSRKLVLIGINDAGKSLVDSAPDLGNRLDVVGFEVEPATKIEELVAAGERAFNVEIACKQLIVENARGSFYVAQLLCLDACVQAEVLERPDEMQAVATSYAAVQRRVVERQRTRFGDTVRSFARGTKFRPGGRAPYLHILRWLAACRSGVLERLHYGRDAKASYGEVERRGGIGSWLPSESCPAGADR